MISGYILKKKIEKEMPSLISGLRILRIIWINSLLPEDERMKLEEIFI